MTRVQETCRAAIDSNGFCRDAPLLVGAAQPRPDGRKRVLRSRLQRSCEKQDRRAEPAQRIPPHVWPLRRCPAGATPCARPRTADAPPDRSRTGCAPTRCRLLCRRRSRDHSPSGCYGRACSAPTHTQSSVLLAGAAQPRPDGRKRVRRSRLQRSYTHRAACFSQERRSRDRIIANGCCGRSCRSGAAATGWSQAGATVALAALLREAACFLQECTSRHDQGAVAT
jgi:hypothetical protein